jgi:glycine cleavage system H protein
MTYPHDLRFTREHEWLRVEEGKTALVGITDYAAEQLGEIVFVDLPVEGEELKKDESFGAVESTKTVSDLFAPVSGKVLEVNSPLKDSPETINDDPYNEGWLVRIEIYDESEIGELMTAEEYAEYVKNQSE